jgi:hypothetical protein
VSTGIKRRNMKRLASLSALGAGVLGVRAGTAQASGIVYSGILDEQIGFCPGCLSYFNLQLPKVRGYERLAFGKISSSMIGDWRSVSFDAAAGKDGTLVRDLVTSGRRGIVGEHPLDAFPLGAKWASGRNSYVHGVIAYSNVRSTGTRVLSFTRFNATDRYFLFNFSGGDLKHDIYGWAQLNVTALAPGLNCADPAPGCVEVTLVDYAYDTSGAQIPAGDTGTPEPSTFVLTGLAALALGAKGLRAWRSVRGPRTAAVPPDGRSPQ